MHAQGWQSFLAGSGALPHFKLSLLFLLFLDFFFSVLDMGPENDTSMNLLLLLFCHNLARQVKPGWLFSCLSWLCIMHACIYCLFSLSGCQEMLGSGMGCIFYLHCDTGSSSKCGDGASLLPGGVLWCWATRHSCMHGYTMHHLYIWAFRVLRVQVGL